MSLAFRVFLILCVLVLEVGASSTTLRRSTGEVHDGHIKQVLKGTVYMRTGKGPMMRIPMNLLDASAKQKVKSWIRKRGGTEEFTSWIGVSSSSFSKPWPRAVYGPQSIELKRIQILTKKQPLIYESKHYRFVLDTKVEPKVVKRFAVLFETTYKYVMTLPVNASGQYLDSKEKFPIYLFGSLSSYHRAGGPQGSAGVYMPRNRSILVPMASLGVTWSGRKWEHVKRSSNLVLSHELTHQLSGGVNFDSWYLEGSAEYVAATRYTHGTYHFGKDKKRVFDYVCGKNGLKDGFGRRLGSRVQMMSLERFMNLPYGQFAGGDTNKNYGVSLLLTYYFYHKEGDGRGTKIKQYIKALQQGESASSAQKLLLGNRSYLQLQKDFKKFCAQSGVTLEFS